MSTRQKQTTIWGVVLCVSLCGFAGAGTWYVDGSLPTPGDGTSWETGFQKIQAGINAATHHDTVIVAEGTYLENIRFNGKNIVLMSTDPLDPDLVARTIIDGNQVRSVVTFDGTEDETCVLSGFTIRNGRATSAGGGICGGTRDAHNHAAIRNTVITGNQSVTSSIAEAGGGVAFCDGLIQNNTISSNSVPEWGYGGGLASCNGVIENNLITANSAPEAGGLSRCNGIIQNNTITSNSAWIFGGRGGGLFGCNGTIRNCIIWGNTGDEGPQMYASSSPVNSCIQDWVGGGRGNISDDPLFADAPGGDYHLQDLSPCIDIGQGFYWFAWPQRDRDGNCRVIGDGIEMGCYEHASSRDSDGDLLSDSDEAVHKTDPLNDDTDGDGLRDGLEVIRRSDPLQSTPPGIIRVPEDMPTIQQSLCVALEGDEIIVGPGRHSENLQFLGTDITLRSSNPHDLSVVESTILDGCGLASVVSFTGDESESCVLSGFTIVGGIASGIRGGTEEKHTHATIENNIISSNSADNGNGGGFAFCDGTIRGNTISENSADQEGGGLYECDGTIENNTISGNSAADNYRGGGGLARCDGVVRNNRIVENSATGESSRGGGLYWCDAIIQNNLIAGNWAKTGGGLNDCWGTVRNNTVYGNWADVVGGLYSCKGEIRNCIIWANSAAPQVHESSVPTYSCIQGWIQGGEENIRKDPNFATVNDYHLQPGSPCIDTGINQDGMWDDVDLDGRPRILHGGLSLTVDMGAYEYYNPIGDSFAPYIQGCDPPPDATNIPVNTDIVLHVKDNGNGVDKTSIVITVNGVKVTPMITGTPLDYTVTYDPPSEFGYLKSVTVTADAGDRCFPANMMERVTYSFTTAEPPPDATPPVIILSGDNPMTLRQATPYAEPGYSATDDRDGDVTANVVVTGSVDHTILGSYFLCYNVSDSAGNPAEEKIRTVNVVEAVPPVITLEGADPVILEGGTPYEEPGYTATDNHDGDITANVVVTGIVDNTYPGSYVLTYSVTDSNGNAAEPKRRVVNVVDTTPPLIKLQGDNPMTLEVGTPYAEPGYTATDICNGDVTEDVVVTGSVDHTILGSYTLHYNVSDWTGNGAEEKTRTVNVVEARPFEVVQIVEPPAEGVIQLTWSSRPGDEYVVWSSTDLSSGVWIQEQTVPSAGDSTSWTDSNPGGLRKFYRVEELEL